MPYKIKGAKKPEKVWMGQVRYGPNASKKVTQRHHTKKEAEAWERKTEGTLISSMSSNSFLNWATEYLRYSRSKFVHKTFLGKKKVFALLSEHKGIEPHTPVEEITPALILKFLTDQLNERGGTAANNYRKDLHAAWEWGIDFCDLPEANPLRRIKKFANNPRPRVVPTIDQFWQAYDVAGDNDKIMLLTFLHTAARREELFRLLWSDVDFDSRKIKLTARKNKTATWIARNVPISQPLFLALGAHRKTLPGNGPVFPNPRSGARWITREKLMPRLCKLSGAPPFGLHGIRHLSASIMAAQNIPLPTIQRFLGHENLTTTQIYIKSLHVDDDGATNFPSPTNREFQPIFPAHLED